MLRISRYIKLISILSIVFFAIGQLEALRLENRYVDQDHFRGPCGCIALTLAGRFSKRSKQMQKEINQARRQKKNLINTDVLQKIAAKAGVMVHCLVMYNGSPGTLGYIEWWPPQKEKEARVEKVRKILHTFKHSQERYLHFLCHLVCDTEDHGILITIDRQKDILYYHLDHIVLSSRKYDIVTKSDDQELLEQEAEDTVRSVVVLKKGPKTKGAGKRNKKRPRRSALETVQRYAIILKQWYEQV